MSEYPKFVKKKLIDVIEALAADPSSFVRDPEKHFTRNRKLGFADMIRFTLVDFQIKQVKIIMQKTEKATSKITVLSN